MPPPPELPHKALHEDIEAEVWCADSHTDDDLDAANQPYDKLMDSELTVDGIKSLP